jgi:hypothetical protein
VLPVDDLIGRFCAHSDKRHYEALSDAIQKFINKGGGTVPLVGADNQILAGHHREGKSLAKYGFFIHECFHLLSPVSA